MKNVKIRTHYKKCVIKKKNRYKKSRSIALIHAHISDNLD